VAEYESQDEPVTKLGAVDVDFARQLERELNAANVEMDEKRKDVVYLATEKAKLENYVMRLEEAGDAMFLRSTRVGREIWKEAKEAKL
jgi:predicted  nucleic acid-binding Zn-ribbon protein